MEGRVDSGHTSRTDGDCAMTEQERLLALPCMQLSAQERQWALAVKHAVEEDLDLQNLTDLEYAQYALVSQNDVDDALRRARGLQLFRQEYGINETLDQAMELINALIIQQPGMLLSVDKAKTNPTAPEVENHPDLHCHYLMVFDFARINPKALHLPRDKRDMLGALYYLHHATQTNPTLMRNGILFIAECEGMTFDNVNVDFVGPIYREMKNFYPINLKEISWLRAATAATVMFALCKPFFPPEVQSKVNLGCEFDAFDGRLDELFLTRETPEENAMLILKRVKNHLTERFHNAALFRLE